MEVMPLLTAGLAVVVVAVLAAAYRRRHGRHVVHTTRQTPMIEVGDADVARRLLIDHADAFSTRTTLSLAVDFDAGNPRTESVTSAPYGPLWRALRSNLTANVLHPSRIGHLLLPIQRDAVEALLADLSPRSAGEAVVAVRDGVYAAVFTAMVRLCLGDGDGLGEREIGAMRRALRRFFHSGVDSRLLARSRMARLVHWRQWRYLVGTRRRLAELFGPVIESRRQSRDSRLTDVDGGGASCSYLESLFDVLVPSNGGDDAAGAAGGESLGSRRPLRDDEIVRLVWEFLGSSTEAVAACVEWTLARLVTEREVQNKLYHELIAAGDVPEQRLQDIRYLRAVIFESLRLHPPLPMVVREVGPEGAAIAGAAPPPDGALMRFLFNAEKIGRETWTEPDRFMPERFLAGGEGEDVSPVPGPKEIKMMPFGAGRRHCPGAGLAMIHVGCLVAALVREFEWAPPAGGGGGVDLTVVDALFVKVMASPLRARIMPRVSRS